MSEALQDVVDFLRSSGELPEPESGYNVSNSGYNVSNSLETIYWDIPNWFVRLDLDHSARSFLLSILKFRTDFLVREFCDTPNAIALFLMNNGACDLFGLKQSWT